MMAAEDEVKVEIPIDARIIKLDHTEYFSIAEADKPYINKIMAVFLYDKNSHTHCCELTPSYWMNFLYHEIEFTEKGNALDEVGYPSEEYDKREELLDSYENEPDDGMYVHVWNIDQLEEELSKQQFRYHVVGNPGVKFEDVPRDEQMEALREHYNCNHVI